MIGSGLVVEDLVVEFVHDGYRVRPLDGLGMEAAPGGLTVLLGPSGSGKTTLLSCLGGILTPTSGRIVLDGWEVTGATAAQLEDYRQSKIGFVFQAFNLIPSLTALENVAIPLVLAGVKRRVALERAEDRLGRVGLGERLHYPPSRLSGGQQQRVAIARALVADPPLLLADEPTANLDYVQAEAIIGLLRELRAEGRIMVVSTHDARLVPVADRTIQMAPDTNAKDGPPLRVEYAAGELIFSQGEWGRLVYVILDGEVEVFRPQVDHGEEHLADLGTGQYFGELGAMLGYPRSASVRAATNVALMAYSARDFRRTVLGD
jgi:putative ABC transport system ATP-binding protein